MLYVNKLCSCWQQCAFDITVSIFCVGNIDNQTKGIESCRPSRRDSITVVIEFVMKYCDVTTMLRASGFNAGINLVRSRMCLPGAGSRELRRECGGARRMQA